MAYLPHLSSAGNAIRLSFAWRNVTLRPFIYNGAPYNMNVLKYRVDYLQLVETHCLVIRIGKSIARITGSQRPAQFSLLRFIWSIVSRSTILRDGSLRWIRLAFRWVVYSSGRSPYLTKCAVLVRKYTYFCFCSYNLFGLSPAKIISDEDEFIDMAARWECCEDSGASYKIMGREYQNCAGGDMIGFRSAILEISRNLDK